ncbi:NAD(P)H-binding protein [Winogradskyella sp.]|uniref:NAD(P)H-binding protein n=1 Tax=Winogradskyella sp. TaxID=1883156 RepID=UPI0025CE14DD|nr:NAD(P)H-binding protein [Winogradskyella sp.]MCT4629547.1 NAD(P)H-binding protein [Winogradskyella sp.]
MKKQISIIGCGWLGFPLAEFLVASDYKIKGSTTSKNKLQTLNQSAIESFLITINEKGIAGNHYDLLSGSDIAIINIPPGLRKNPNKNHVVEIEHLIKAIEAHNIKYVIYISSTSVFKDKNNFPLIDGKTQPNATSNTAKQLIAIEELLKKSNLNTTILRFGGLFDEQRHPANYLSGKKNIPNPNAPINLIHKKDCINIISLILKKEIYNVSLNAVNPKHPQKKAYYTNYCKQHHLELPEFNYDEISKGKTIESSQLENLLNYTFKQAL